MGDIRDENSECFGSACLLEKCRILAAHPVFSSGSVQRASVVLVQWCPPQHPAPFSASFCGWYWAWCLILDLSLWLPTPMSLYLAHSVLLECNVVPVVSSIPRCFPPTTPCCGCWLNSLLFLSQGATWGRICCCLSHSNSELLQCSEGKALALSEMAAGSVPTRVTVLHRLLKGHQRPSHPIGSSVKFSWVHVRECLEKDNTVASRSN